MNDVARALAQINQCLTQHGGDLEAFDFICAHITNIDKAHAETKKYSKLKMKFLTAETNENIQLKRELAIMRQAFKIAIYSDRDCNNCPYTEVVQPEGGDGCQPDGCEKWCLDRARADFGGEG